MSKVQVEWVSIPSNGAKGSFASEKQFVFQASLGNLTPWKHYWGIWVSPRIAFFKDSSKTHRFVKVLSIHFLFTLQQGKPGHGGSEHPYMAPHCLGLPWVCQGTQEVYGREGSQRAKGHTFRLNTAALLNGRCNAELHTWRLQNSAESANLCDRLGERR